MSALGVTAAQYTVDPVDSNYYIQLPDSLAIDSAQDSNAFIQTSESALSQYNKTFTNSDFAIYLEVPKWTFFNGAMDWKYSISSQVDPVTGAQTGSVVGDSSGLLSADILLSDSLKTILKTQNITSRFAQFRQNTKFLNWSFKVGNPIDVPLLDASSSPVLDSSNNNAQITRRAQLYAVYIDKVTGDPLPYSVSDLNSNLFYFVDNVSLNSALSTLADNGPVTFTADGSGYPQLSVVPPHSDMARRVPDSSGAGDNNLTYWANLASNTVFEYPPVGLRSSAQNEPGATISTGNIMMDSNFSALSVTSANNPWQAFSKGGSSTAWSSVAGRYTGAFTNGYTGSTLTSCGGINVSGEWIQLQTPAAFVLRNYTVTRIANEYGPAQMTLLGSNNGTTWAMLDTNSNMTWGAISTLNRNLLTNNTAYSYYRLVFQLNYGDVRTGVASVTLTDALGINYPAGQMTGYSTVFPDGTYTASASSEASSSLTPAWAAFTTNLAQYYLTPAVYSWSGVLYAGGTTITEASGSTIAGEDLTLVTSTPVWPVSYTITTSGFIEAPVEFRLYGSYNSFYWYNLDTETGITDWGNPNDPNSNTKTFTCNTNLPAIYGLKSPFNILRLWVSRVSSGQRVTIKDFRINVRNSIFPSIQFPPTNMVGNPTQTVANQNTLTNGTYNLKAGSAANLGAVQNVMAFRLGAANFFDPVSSYFSFPYIGNTVTIDASTNIAYSGEWIQLQTSSGISVSGYQVGGQNARTWTVMGSNDGLRWRWIDSSMALMASGYGQSEISSWGAQYYTYPTTAVQPSYTYFRYIIHDSGQKGLARCNEWRLLDSNGQAYPPSTMTSNTLTVSGVTYNSSASLNSNIAYYAFEAQFTSPNNVWAAGTGQYSSQYFYSRGTLNTTDTSGNNYPGEWIQLDCSQSIRPTAYNIAWTFTDVTRTAGTWVLLGNNVDSSAGWTLLDYRNHNASGVIVDPLTDVSYNTFNNLANGIIMPFTLNPNRYSATATGAASFKFFRLVVTRALYFGIIQVNRWNIQGIVADRGLPSNAFVWSPPIIRPSWNSSYRNTVRHMSSDPSRAVMLYWDVDPRNDRPYAGNEYYLAYSNVNLGGSTTALMPLKDLTAASISAGAFANTINKFSVTRGYTAGTVAQIREGLRTQSVTPSGGTIRLNLPISNYQVSTLTGTQTSATIKSVPFQYEAGNAATFDGDLARINPGGRLMQILTHFLFNGMSDTEMRALSTFKSEAWRLTDAFVDQLSSLVKVNSAAALARRQSLISQLLVRYGRHYFDDSITTQAADGSYVGDMREVLRTLEDMYLNFSVQFARRIARRASNQVSLLNFAEIPVLIKLTNTMFPDNRSLIMNFDAQYVNASGATPSGTLVTTWPNLSYRSQYLGFGSLDRSTATTVSGLTASGAFLGTVTGNDGTSLPAIYLDRAQNSFLTIPTVNFAGSLAASGFTLAMVCAFTGSAASYESPFMLGGDVTTLNNNISVMRGATGTNAIFYVGIGSASGQTLIMNTSVVSQRTVYILTVAPSGSTCSVNTWTNGTRNQTNFAYSGNLANINTYSFNYMGRTINGRQNFTGTIQQVQFYNRALTVNEATQLSAALRARWRI